MTRSWSDSLQYYKDVRLWRIFALGISSGFPWVMIGSAMSAWLAEEGLTRSAIGFFGVIFIAYSINFSWSPLVDRVQIPWLTQLLGQRRSWVLITQLGVAVSCVAIAFASPSEELWFAKTIAFVLALFSATQDISIDAYRIDSIPESDNALMSAGSAMATAGWWTGFAGLGAIPLLVVDLQSWSWADVYLLMAGGMLLLALVPLFSPEPEDLRSGKHSEQAMRYRESISAHSWASALWLQSALVWLLVSFVEPLREFFRRNGLSLAISILLFIFLFKIGEAFLGRMSIVFYKEIGFSNSDIAVYSKLVSWWVTIVFSLIGSLVTMRYGIVRGLFVGGIAMAASNLMFAVLAIIGPSKGVLVSAVIIDGFTTAWSTVAFVAFLSVMCNRAFTASQYALMASLGTLGRTLLSSSSGWLVDSLDGNWLIFFVITALMVVPSLVFLYLIKDRLRGVSDQL